MFELHMYDKSDMYTARARRFAYAVLWLDGMNLYCLESSQTVYGRTTRHSGQIRFCLRRHQPQQTRSAAQALATVKFYLNDGFSATGARGGGDVDLVRVQRIRKCFRLIACADRNSTTARLKTALRAAKGGGEEITIAFIGGSITQGAGARAINTNVMRGRLF